MFSKMNKLKIYLAFMLVGLSGCEDYLDKSPDFGLTEEDVFSKYESARGFLDDNYNQLVDIHNWDSQNITNFSISSLSDESASVTTNNDGLVINSGNWLNKPNMGEMGWNEHNSTASLNPVIGRAFSSIRVANKVIANTGKIPNITPEQKAELLGQAYFFRSWWYFQIIQRWGGMPIFDQVYAPTDNMDFPRLTYQASSEWLISGLDSAIKYLPHVWEDAQHGRATKGAALGLRSMAALYAASPLMNNGLQLVQNNGYNQQWAERAAEYGHQAIQYVQDGTGGHRYRLMPKAEYSKIFYNTNYASDESLWFRVDGGTRDVRDFTALYMTRRFANLGGNGHSAMNFVNPTQNLVEMFETSTGYPINHPQSGYKATEPFKNRDPRLANNILVPGEEFGRGPGNRPLYLETYVGGVDFDQLLTAPVSAPRMASGYGLKKFVWPEANGYTKEYKKYFLNTIYIRVAQLYLDYAEAMNEAYGPTADPKGYGLTAVDAINMIRNRVGMPAVKAEFTGTKEAFRERIRNERAVELSFENHRWHDLRRWMIAEEVFKKPLRGIRATPKGPTPYKSFTYQEVVLTPEQRVFTPRHYWYPVAQDHVENLYNFPQNPGW